MNCVRMYSHFTFQPLRDQYIGILELMNKFTLKYLSSDRLVSGGPARGEKIILETWADVLCGCDPLQETNEGS